MFTAKIVNIPLVLSLSVVNGRALHWAPGTAARPVTLWLVKWHPKCSGAFSCSSDVMKTWLNPAVSQTCPLVERANFLKSGWITVFWGLKNYRQHEWLWIHLCRMPSKFLSPTFQVFFTLTRTHYTRTVAYSELCVDRLVYLLYKTMLLGWLRVFISVLMHAQSDQLRTDIPKARSLCIKRILICTHHPSLILYLSSSVPAEGHNMAGSFREALKVPDAPCCLSKHGAAVHKDAYCVPASVHAGVWINVFILRGLPELGFLTAGVHSHTYH